MLDEVEKRLLEILNSSDVPAALQAAQLLLQLNSLRTSAVD